MPRKTPPILAIFLAAVAAFAMLVLLALPEAKTGEKVLFGRARVTDGDSIEIRNMRIRLHGIDAPEGRQTCSRNGSPWRCGWAAARALGKRIGGERVVCSVVSIDPHGRFVSRCTHEEEDIAAWMVREGWALAYRRYSTAYVDEEKRPGRRAWAYGQANSRPRGSGGQGSGSGCSDTVPLRYAASQRCEPLEPGVG